MRINQNIAAMNAYRNLSATSSQQSKSLERLSSGFRINRAADDAAGLAISEKLRGQVKGLNQAVSNAQNGISLLQTAEGALNESHSILQRMRELAVQSASDTNTDDDRTQIQKEVNQLSQELSRIGVSTEFNTKNLLDGSFSNAVFQIGANEGQSLRVTIGDVRAFELGVTGAVTTESTTTTGAVAATGASVTGSAAATALTAGAAGNLVLDVDGTAVTVALAAADTAAAVVTKINAAANTALGTTGTTYASEASGVLTLASDTTGASSSVTVTSGAGTMLAELQLTAGQTDTGSDAVAGTATPVSLANSALQAGDYTIDTAGAVTDGTGAAVGTYDAATGTITDANSAVLATATGGPAAGTAWEFSVGGVDVASAASASAAITTIQTAIDTVSEQRSSLGAIQNRLDHTINNLNVASENLSASESRIRDTDMAAEMMNFTRAQILSQAGTAMLAQANQIPQGVLSLLR